MKDDNTYTPLIYPTNGIQLCIKINTKDTLLVKKGMKQDSIPSEQHRCLVAIDIPPLNVGVSHTATLT